MRQETGTGPTKPLRKTSETENPVPTTNGKTFRDLTKSMRRTFMSDWALFEKTSTGPSFEGQQYGRTDVQGAGVLRSQ